MNGHDRRDFLKALTAGAVAAGVPAWAYARPINTDQEPAPPVRDPRYREWSNVALAEAKRLGCSYADIRFTRNRAQSLTLRNGQIFAGGGRFGGDGFGGRGGGGTTETYGFGVRVIHNGVWGFSSSPVVTPDEIKRVTGIATDIARASAIAKKTDVRLAPVEKYDEYWQMPFEKDPWTVPLEEKVELLRSVTSAIQKTPGILFATATAGFEYEWKYLATSEGSYIEQLFRFCNCSASATARTGSQVKTRNYDQALGGGYEFLIKCDLPGNAERIAAEAIEHSKAKPVGQGLKDLILLPSHLALTIHEIVAHPTELDRIAGYEANYAGTSFIKIADVGKLKYGSPKFNITADRTFPGAMATVGFDDDGVKSQKWPIVKDGILVGLQTNRETAHLLNENFSRGCTFANHWRNYPFLRMPNIQMEAGPAGSPDRRRHDCRRQGRRPGRRHGQLQHRSAALQRPVRRRCILGDQERQEDADGDRLHLQRHHHRLLGQPRRRRPAVGMAARRHDGRRQGSAGPVQSSVARIVAVPHSPGHGRRSVRVERLRPERGAESLQRERVGVGPHEH